MSFSELKLIEPLCRALEAERYERPTPIQQKAIPVVLEGRDLLGCAQTGTGKTAAFVLPILQLLATSRGDGRIRALVLAPTRELAAQIDERVSAYGKHLGLRHTVVFGGVNQNRQVRALRPAPAVLVATPGRLLDLVNQRFIDLSAVEVLVLDEADRMLDMGFIHDVRKIVALTPKDRQTLLFSATMPRDIVDLARSILKDPVRIDVAPASATPDRVQQSVYFVARADKRRLLERLLRNVDIDRALVFTRTKRGASRVAKLLDGAGIRADAIHGDKTQGARLRALSDFKRGATRVLVATDIAARGIDVDGVSHVINYDMPDAAESYVHRIGRTGRAGASGIALSFCDNDERAVLRDIEKLMGRRVPTANGETGTETNHHDGQQPSNDGQQPRNGEQQARNGGQQPRNGGQQPRNGGKQPRNGGQQPRNGGQQPRFDGQQARNGGQQPRFDGQQPRNDGQQPRNGGQQPRYDGQQPRNGGQPRDVVRSKPPRGNVAECSSSPSPNSPGQSNQRSDRWPRHSERRRTSSSWS